MTIIRTARAGLCAALLSLTLGGTSAVAQPVSVVDAARASLPAKLRDDGVLKIATSLQWAPFAYRSEKDEAVGIDISLMKLLAAKLGLRPDFDDLKFPASARAATRSASTSSPCRQNA